MTGRNRLGEEASPYLQQHADNPVHWQPWDDAALADARERDVPIFLSIGYSACHWCHVMEEESFEDPDVARLLNESFVPIKVDREERPDVDSIYMTVSQLVTGRGGWPLSVWLTPEGKPFHVGTYFPPEPRQGMPGFAQLCERITELWADPEERANLEARADQWANAVSEEVEVTPEAPGSLSESPLIDAADAALRSADREYGGFGSGGPKFPQPGNVHLLLRAFDQTDRDAYADVARGALDAMAEGGLNDHVGKGFHRYCVDRSWTVPHFEKMLYDQAELVRAFLAGRQALDEPHYGEVAGETLAFVERELTHPEGGFFSTLDARSGGEEGTFYVWTPAEIHDALDDDLAAELFCARYGVTEAGNFEDHTTVLTEVATVSDLAAEYALDVDEVRTLLESARETLFAAREDRVRPARDEKVLAGWNGLMISAFAEAALVLDAGYAAPAERALAFVREHLWDGERLARRFKDGDVKGEGYLEDYAFLGRGALDLYEATGNVDHLAFALDLARVIEAEFWDSEARTLYFTPESGESLVARPQELGDASTPSSAGVAVELLDSLAAFAPHDRFADIADATLATHAARLRSNPLGHASLALAADDHARGHLELTVAASHLPEAWRRRLAGAYLPGRLLSLRPPTDEELAPWLDRLGLAAAPPIWASREARDGPTVYTCRSFTCSPPQTDIDAALEWAAKLAPDGEN
jgi:uncharacterized protein YyaL (SSP411 family)